MIKNLTNIFYRGLELINTHNSTVGGVESTLYKQK